MWVIINPISMIMDDEKMPGAMDDDADEAAATPASPSEEDTEEM
jgi:hypothetical protein